MIRNCSKNRQVGAGIDHKSGRDERISLAGGAEMNIIESIVDGFIMTVGITPPKPDKRRTAVIFIATGLFGTIAAVLALVGFVIHRLAR
jgi:hypothetical protein